MKGGDSSVKAIVLLAAFLVGLAVYLLGLAEVFTF